MFNLRLRPSFVSFSHKSKSVNVCRRCLATIAGTPLPLPLVSQSVRTRFAPSPTGALHLGSLRTALFNFLLAKHYNGQFILRIEDTDRNRTIDGAVEEMCRLLKWAGIEWDEGPGVGGVQGPYRQSERLKIYKGLSDCLIDSNRAYRCFCPTERLDKVRTEAQRYKQQGNYDRHCHKISPEESRARVKSNKPHVVRLLSPEQWPTVNDYLHGDVHFPTPAQTGAKLYFDDPILLKSDGWPTYHLACVIDDHLMEISHVIRGDEWLPSTPKHLVLYEAFGWKPPVFVHLPLLHSLDGKKLSKRDINGDKSFLVKHYEKDGILPEALVNFVALFGWSSKTESDVHSMQELIQQFSLDGLTSGNIKVSPDKLPFLNHQHILRKLESKSGMESLVKSAMPFLKEYLTPGEMPDKKYLEQVIRVSQERMHTLKDVYQAGPYFFTEPDYSSAQALKFRQKHEASFIVEVLRETTNRLQPLTVWEAEQISEAIKLVEEALNLPAKVVMQILRYALAGLKPGVGIPVIIQILGKSKVLSRLKACQ